MKFTLKSVAFVAMLAMAVSASAQSFSVRAGYLNSVETSAIGEVDGFQVGVQGETGLSNPMFSVQYGLLYNLLSRTDNLLLGAKSNYSGHLIDLPVHLKVALPLMSDLSVFADAGPQLNFGLAQSIVTKNSNGNVLTESDRYDKNSDLSRFDIQLGVGGGVQFKNIQLRVGYDWGMLDINKNKNTTWNRNQLTATVAYGF